MKEKLYSGLFAVLGLGLCLSLFAGFLVFGPSQPCANEVLTPKPQLRSEEGVWNRDYLPELANYVSDRFWGRQQLITLHNRLEAAIFETSGENSVILGEDGWLYYASTLSDYTGTTGRSDRDLYSAARNLYLLQETCENQGMTFTFALAPDKNALYPQYFPDAGAVAGQRDGERLLKLLEDLGVRHTDLFSAFRSQDETLYFAHDSHWNSRGAALGADCILESLGRESHYFEEDFSQSQPHTGDLWQMLYPAALDPETDPVYGGTLNSTVKGTATRPDSITLDTLGQGTGTLFAWRDSFGNLLYPYLADSFASARFSRSTVYDLSRAEAMGADTVVLELVERNLSQLTDDPPLLEAPVRSVKSQAQGTGTISLTVLEDSAAPAETVCFSGTAPAEADWDSPVYLLWDGTAYEACLGTGNRFTAFLPQGAAPEQVMVRVGGVLTAYAADRTDTNES